MKKIMELDEMKIILINICICIVFLLSSPTLSADDVIPEGTSAGEFIKVGAAGGQFLKIGPGGRANGMGGAYGAVADDLTSIFWNPAGLADINGMAANFSYTQWFADFSHNFGAVALPLGDDFAIGLSLISFTSGEIPKTTIDNPSGDGTYYTVSDLCVGLTFSGYLTEQFSFGFTGKYVQNAFSSLSAGGIAFDVGTKFKTGIQGITLGFSIHNLGVEQEYSGQDLNGTDKLWESMDANPLDIARLSSPFTLPLMFRAGISSDIIRDETNALVAALDFITYSDISEQFAIGVEYVWNDLVSIRGGYLYGQDQFGIAGGAGLKYIGGGFNGEINYSINPMRDLGLVNRLSIAIIVD